MSITDETGWSEVERRACEFESCRFSDALEAEIAYHIDDVDHEDGKPSRDQVIQQLMQDCDDPSCVAHEFKQELESFGIRSGIYQPNTKAQIDAIVRMGRGKKYDFKRGEIYYTFESWKPLNLE